MTRDEGRAQEQGIVDQQDAAMAAAEQAGADRPAGETDDASRAARAGIVDQQDAALEASEPASER